MGPDPTIDAVHRFAKGFNAELERMREAGVLGKTLPEGRPGLAEVNKNLALTIGELSNIAAEALTFLEDETVMDLFSFNERTRVRALRKRLEEACRSVS